MSTQPTDAEIVALMRDGNNCNYNDEGEHIDFARAVLAKWGQPAQAAEPVARTLASHAAGEAGYCLFSRPVPSETPLYAASQPVAREPLSHAQAKALVLKYGNDPLNLVFQVELAHGIKGDQHVTNT